MYLKKLCECGCGEKVNHGKRFVWGHNGRVKSKETLQKMSKTLRGRVKTEEHKRKISNSLMGHVVSESTLQKMSDSRQGGKQSEEAKCKMRKVWTDPVVRNRITAAMKETWARPDVRENQSRIHKRLCENDSYRFGLLTRLRKGKNRPNKTEQKMGCLLDEQFPGEWKYVGDGSFILDGYNPDFININGKKLIIELFGDYWHRGEDPADRARLFEPFGFKTLVIWEHELKDMGTVGGRVEEFQGGG